MAVTAPMQGVVWEDAGAYFMARVQGNSGANVTQGSLSSISASVYDLSADAGPTLIAGPTAVTISSTIFDTLQTDSRWTKDTTGYNFGYAAPASWFPTGSHKYRVEFLVTPASGAVFWVVYEVVATNVFTS